MFAKSYPPILSGTLLAAAWLSTTAAGRTHDQAEQRFEVAEMADPGPASRLPGAGAGLADNDVRIGASVAGSDAGPTVSLYWPAGEGPYPVLVYFRETGPEAGDTGHAEAARALAGCADAVVVSVSLPAGQASDLGLSGGDSLAGSQAYQAYRWTLANADGLGGDPHRVAVTGVGMAGAVAMAVAAQAQDAQLPPPYYLVLADTPTPPEARPLAPASAKRQFQDIAWAAGDGRSARSTNKTYRAM